MRLNVNIQTKAVILVAGILSIILTINTAVITFVAYNKYKQSIISKTLAIGEGLQRELNKVLKLGVPLGSIEGLNAKLNDLISRDEAIGYAMVTDPTGRIVFHNDTSLAGKKLGDNVSIKAAESKTIIIQKTGSFYDLGFPLSNNGGNALGTLRLGVKIKAINSQLLKLLSLAFGISTFCFVLAIILVYFSISKVITRPILAMEQAADKIAAGNLTYTVDVTGRDEVASLGIAINRMTYNLKDVLSKISTITDSVSTVTSNVAESFSNVMSASDVQKKAIEETASAIEDMDQSISKVSDSTESLAESSSDTSTAIIEMKASIENVARNATIFSETAQDTASSIEEMVSNIKQIAESVENLSISSGEIAASIEEVNATTKDIEHRADESVALAETVMNNASEKGIKASSAAMEGMETIKKSVATLSEVINMLGKKTENIGKILTVIDDVADKTSLLALNAAILASKAGEHGKGFSVVANEIKDLAERTSASTSDISTLVKSVQTETKSSIVMASEGINAVEEGIKLVTDLNEVLREIAESSKASTEMSRAIQRATTAEAMAVKQITNAIESMTEQTARISSAIQEQSRGSSFILEASDKVKEISHQVKNATGEQKDSSTKITAVIENVAQQTVQIAEFTKMQKEKSIEIVQSMEKIRNSTSKLISSSHEMNDVINSLKQDAMNLITEMRKFQV